MNTQRRLQIHHVVFEAGFDDVVMLVALIAETLPGVFAHPMQRQHLDAREVVFITRQDHAAFAGRNILRRIETETTEISEGAGFAAVILGFDRVGAVFNQF